MIDPELPVIVTFPDVGPEIVASSVVMVYGKLVPSATPTVVNVTVLDSPSVIVDGLADPIQDFNGLMVAVLVIEPTLIVMVFELVDPVTNVGIDKEPLPSLARVIFPDKLTLTSDEVTPDIE